MNNGKKGVTIIALGIAIIVMGMLVGLVSISISDLITETQVKEFASELHQLEYLVREYKTINNGNMNFTSHTISTSDISSEFLEQISEETITDNTVTLYVVDFEKIDAMDTNYGRQEEGSNDIYLVSQETGNVYYKLGFDYDEKIYYTLTDELKDMLEY